MKRDWKPEMLSVFDRIRNAFSQSESLSKAELFKNASIPNTPSNKALFQILLENGKLIKVGERRTARYRLPIIFHVFTPPKEGVYRFTVGLSPQEMKTAEIGDFMMLLMEGVKRVDEVNESEESLS